VARAVSGQRESGDRATDCAATAIRGPQLVLLSVVHATFESRHAGVSNIGIWRLRSAFYGFTPLFW